MDEETTLVTIRDRTAIFSDGSAEEVPDWVQVEKVSDTLWYLSAGDNKKKFPFALGDSWRGPFRKLIDFTLRREDDRVNLPRPPIGTRFPIDIMEAVRWLGNHSGRITFESKEDHRVVMTVEGEVGGNSVSRAIAPLPASQIIGSRRTEALLLFAVQSMASDGR